MLLVNISWRFQKNGLLQSRGFEAAGKYLGCQMAGCYWGLPLPHRAGHGCRRHRDPGRGLPGGQQALDPIGVRPRHNDHLGLAHAGRYWQVDMNCRSKMGSKLESLSLKWYFLYFVGPNLLFTSRVRAAGKGSHIYNKWIQVYRYMWDSHCEWYMWVCISLTIVLQIFETHVVTLLIKL